jgi:hypothetical protein
MLPTYTVPDAESDSKNRPIDVGFVPFVANGDKPGLGWKLNGPARGAFEFGLNETPKERLSIETGWPEGNSAFSTNVTGTLIVAPGRPPAPPR